MISNLLTAIEPEIKALDFIEKYGGLTKVARRKVTINDAFTQFREESFPISQNTSEYQCFNNGKYMELCPDEMYHSVSFFEDVDGMSFTGYKEISNRRRAPVFTGYARFVFWANYQKMGLEETEYSDLFALSLMGAMNKRKTNFNTGFPVMEATYTVNKIEPQSQNPFEKYSFRDIGQLMLYPFGYVSLILEVKAAISPACFNGVELKDPIPCI